MLNISREFHRMQNISNDPKRFQRIKTIENNAKCTRIRYHKENSTTVGIVQENEENSNFFCKNYPEFSTGGPDDALTYVINSSRYVWSNLYSKKY